MKGLLPDWLDFPFHVAGEEVWASAKKVLYWPKEKTLFLADCHFGKVAHFRQSGIGVPQEAGNQTFFELNQILFSLKPDRVVFLGDLFHSRVNLDFDRFLLWKSGFIETEFHLVMGNHDQASAQYLKNSDLNLHQKLSLGPFHCSHYPIFDGNIGFNLSGHLHPAFHLSGLANQSITCPCFWIGPRFMVLPAFGGFTGFAKVKPGKTDQILAIAGTRLFHFKGSILQATQF